MARPRRAKNQPARVLIPLVLLIGIAVALFGWRTDYTFDIASQLAPAAPTPTASSSPQVSTATPTTDRSEDSREAAKALKSCRTRVEAGDAVIEAATTGVGNWSEHVEAQTKANRDKITVTMLDKVFDKTRDAGPEDQKRYSERRAAYRAAKGSCEPVVTAPNNVADALKKCHERAEAQRRAMRAAEPAMGDWKSHLEQMRHSQKHPQPDDQKTWLKAWRAAPPNIKAFDEAKKEFEDDAPRCTGPK